MLEGIIAAFTVISLIIYALMGGAKLKISELADRLSESLDASVVKPLPQSGDFEDTGAGAYLGSRRVELEPLEFTLREPSRPAAQGSESLDLASLPADPPRQAS